MFNGEPASTEVIDAIGRPIGASASCNGVTVTADAVVGNRWNYVVAFSIARDDGEPFDVTPNEAGTLPLMFDGPSGVNIDWTNGGGGGIHFYDADPTDNAIQMVESMSADTFDGRSIIGNTARVHLENPYALDGAGEPRLIAAGSRGLKFTMNYEDTTIDLPAGFSVDYHGLSADIESVAISPIGITVDYTAHDVMNWQEQGDGKMSEHNTAETNRILNLPILIELANGTTIDATESGAVHQLFRQLRRGDKRHHRRYGNLAALAQRRAPNDADEAAFERIRNEDDGIDSVVLLHCNADSAPSCAHEKGDGIRSVAFSAICRMPPRAITATGLLMPAHRSRPQASREYGSPCFRHRDPLPCAARTLYPG